MTTEIDPVETEARALFALIASHAASIAYLSEEIMDTEGGRMAIEGSPDEAFLGARLAILRGKLFTQRTARWHATARLNRLVYEIASVRRVSTLEVWNALERASHSADGGT